MDIFSKDFLFVPIHDDLHWSLVIICHPGVEPLPRREGRGRRASGGSVAGEGAGEAGAADEGPTPCMLHLDSMTGGCSGWRCCLGGSEPRQDGWGEVSRGVSNHRKSGVGPAVPMACL